MLSTVTLRDLGDLRAGFNAAVSGGGGGGSRGVLQTSACSRPAWPRQATAANLAALPDLGPNRRRGWSSPLLRDAPRPGEGSQGGLVPDASSHWGSRRMEDNGRGRPGGAEEGISPSPVGALCPPPASPLSPPGEAGPREGELRGRAARLRLPATATVSGETFLVSLGSPDRPSLSRSVV